MSREIKTITGSFSEDNENVYNQGLRSGLDPIAAFKNTPFYKVASRLGFLKVIDPGSLTTRWSMTGEPHESVRFTVSRR